MEKRDIIIKEILHCFKLQYPEKIKEFEDLINFKYHGGGYIEFVGMAKTYDKFIDTMTFLIELIGEESER